MIDVNSTAFRNMVYGCWMGKNIGGTLGGPWEAKKFTHALTFYDPLPDEATPNDDLDLQLVWLKMLEEEGTDPSVRTFAEYWSRYASRYPWNEYGFFMRNFERGLRPPVAGCFENYFVDEMGSPIRSEIWACLHPADPQSAAAMAWKDSALDHAGGEGMYGEMFWAALQSAAFVEKDPMTLIRIGLNMIPLSSHVARSIREAVWCHENNKTWGQAREKIASQFGHVQACNAVPNHGFTIIGWLYGRDFGDKLCKAVNCGYDTDCTGATLGALLGILDGSRGIPAKWSDVVGDKIALHKFTGPCDPPTTIRELTDRTIALTRQAQDHNSASGQPESADFTDLRTRLFRNELAQKALEQDIHAGIEQCGNNEVWLHYGGEPVIYPDIGKTLSVSMKPDQITDAELQTPKGWTCVPLDATRFRIAAPEMAIKDGNTITVIVNGEAIDFTMLGPGAAQGFEAGTNVESCPKCGARINNCMCD